MFPVLAAAGGAIIAGLLALPDKAALLGPTSSKMRIELVDKARRFIDEVPAQHLDSAESTKVRKDLALLRRSKTGWSSPEELSAFGRVVSTITDCSSKMATEAIKDAFKGK